MKRFDPKRADKRPIEAKALGLIMAMDTDAAARLQAQLSEMAAKKCKRATMFVPKQVPTA